MPTAAINQPGPVQQRHEVAPAVRERLPRSALGDWTPAAAPRARLSTILAQSAERLADGAVEATAGW